jgi:para-nitrobenzyl esterase
MRRGLVAAALAVGTGCVTVIAPGASPPVALAGTSWAWQRSDGPTGRTEVAQDPSRYTIRFGVEGALALRVDCNRGRGSYRAGPDGSLALSRLATTKKRCPEGSQDQAFLRALRGVTAYAIEGDGLVLRGGEATMHFVPAR